MTPYFYLRISADNITPISSVKTYHASLVLCDVLHSLPVRQQIPFNVALTAFDCVCDSITVHFKDVCIPVADISSQSNLCLAQRGDMVVPQTTIQLGRGVFTLQHHCTSRLEYPSYPPLINILQLKTIQRWFENPDPSLQPSLRHLLRTVCLYLLTYIGHCLSAFRVVL